METKAILIPAAIVLIALATIYFGWPLFIVFPLIIPFWCGRRM